MSTGLVREPWWTPVLRDVLCAALLVAIVGPVVAAVTLLPPARFPWLDVPGRILAGILVELVVLGTLRMLVPTVRPGAHRIGWNDDYLRWVASSALNDVAQLPILRAPFGFLHFGRILYFKVLGARLPWTVSLPAQLTVRDPSLWIVEPGVQVEPGVMIEAALHGAGRVRVGRVVLGAGCLVGAHAVLMPGAVIANDARVGPRALVGEQTRIGVGAVVGANAHIERSADVGSYATVGGAALIGASSELGDRARVSAGASVEPETLIAEREHWAGVPARRMP